MSTGWAEVVNAALTVIDDERLAELIAISPAQFYRKMSAYVRFALPMLNRPPELSKMLREGAQAPRCDESIWISTAQSLTGQTEIATGKIGYGLFSASLRLPTPAGDAGYEPYPAAAYDAETGVVTMPAQSAEGLEYSLDFYEDGTLPTLSDAQTRLAAMAVAIVWDQRFERDWLSITPKLHDSSFDPVNEATYMEKGSQRLQRNISAFNDALRHYEQDCAYATATQGSGGRIVMM